MFEESEGNGDEGYSMSWEMMDSDNLLLRLSDRSSDGYIKSYRVSNDGKTLTNDWFFEFETNYTRHNQPQGLRKIDNNSYLVVHADGSADGYLKVFDIDNIDTTKPKIMSSQLSRTI